MTVSLVLSSFHAVSLYCSILAQHPLKISSNQNALWKIHLSIHELVCVSMPMNISWLSHPAPFPITNNEINAFCLSAFAGWNSTCSITMPILSWPLIPLPSQHLHLGSGWFDYFLKPKCLTLKGHLGTMHGLIVWAKDACHLLQLALPVHPTATPICVPCFILLRF